MGFKIKGSRIELREVVIEWEDSASPPEMAWRHASELDNEAGEAPCRSYGVIVKETPNSIVLVPHFTILQLPPSDDVIPANMIMGDMVIPKRSIRWMADLRYKPAPMKKGKRK